MSKVGKAESIAHEGSHGVDDHKPGVAAGAFWKFYDTEYHAYQAEAAVDRGLGKKNETDPFPVWTPMMSEQQQTTNIKRDAFQNATADCNGDPGCHP
jgi:hypothetical protein